MSRNYAHITEVLQQQVHDDTTLEERLKLVVDVLWEHLHDWDVSWVGFYLKDPDADQLLLRCRRDKPACSPIGMHGACGQAFRSKHPLVVDDVSSLGEGYVACDPRDRSEIVLPIQNAHGQTIGVLDVDSFELSAFDDADLDGLRRVLHVARLTS